MADTVAMETRPKDTLAPAEPPHSPSQPASQSDSSRQTMVVEVSQLLANFAQNEPIFDNELLYPTPQESEISKFQDGRLIHATIESIVTCLTSPDIIDYQLMVDFFLSFRNFIDSLPLLELLLCRFTWALKRSLSADESVATTGKLALVRTFVTLRHWILNHFQDDFLNDRQMRELFTSTINEIPKHAYFVGHDPGDLQAKVVVDLKKSYVVMCHIFWNTSAMSNVPNAKMLYLDVKDYETMPVSRLSRLGLRQLNDATTRRSGILSMVERNSTSSLNLLLRERAEMMSLENMLKTANYNHNSHFDTSSTLTPPDRLGDEKFILHPKASLASLRMEAPRKSAASGATLDRMYTNMVQHMKATPVHGVKELTVAAKPHPLRLQTDNEEEANKENPGFSVRGRVEIFKDSEVKQIAPSTPLKKLNTRIEEPPRRHQPRKTFIKHLFQQREHHTHHSAVETVKPDLPCGRISKVAKLERTINTNGKMDVLSTRAIEDYNALKERSRRLEEEDDDEDIIDMDKVMSEVDTPTKSAPSRLGGSREEMLHQSDLLTSVSAPASSGFAAATAAADASSFASPSVSLNWSNDMDLSNSQHIQDLSQTQIELKQIDDVSDAESGRLSLPETTRYSQDLSVNGPESRPVLTSSLPPPRVVQRDTVETSLTAPADVPLVFAPQDAELTVPRRVSAYVGGKSDHPMLSEAESDARETPSEAETPSETDTDARETSESESTHEIMPAEPADDPSTAAQEDIDGRFSVKLISRDSIVSHKSYMTYDSSLSSGPELKESAGQLRKKNAFVNLRRREKEDSSETLEAQANKKVSMIPSPAQSAMLPYPGISQTAIAELAAIPDNKIDMNPIEYARNKLRGQAKTAAESYDKSAQSSPSGSGTGTIEELRLERKVRDLFIARDPNKAASESGASRVAETETPPKTETVPSVPAVTPVHQTRRTRRALYNSSLIKHDAQRNSSFDLRSLSLTPLGLSDRTQLMSVQEAIYRGNHLPFVLSYETEVLYQQMTLIERDLLLEIDWKELAEMKWDKPLVPYSSWLRLLMDHSDKTGLQMVTLRFNLVTNWIISEILLCKSLNVRALTISRFIHLASTLKKHQNYASMFQITLALTSPTIKRLRTTWSHVDAGELLVLKELKDVTSEGGNFAAIRSEMDVAVPSKGVVPFLALDLSDLNVNADRPNIIRPEGDASGKSSSRQSESGLSDASDSDRYELINFDKFRTRCTILKKILRQIDWSKFYRLKRDDEALSKCLYISSLSQEEMDYCFDHLEQP